MKRFLCSLMFAASLVLASPLALASAGAGQGAKIERLLDAMVEMMPFGQVFDMLELGIVAAARGYGVSIGDLLLVAEDVEQGRLALPLPTAVFSGCSYYLVWPKARRGQERFQRLRDYLLAEVAAMGLPVVSRC